MKNLKCLLPVLALLLLLATPVRAQLQPPDNSLLFNGMGQSVVITNFSKIVPFTEITVEVWVYATAIAGQTAFAMNFGTPTDRFAASISYTGNADYWDFGNINVDGTGPGRLAFPQNPIGKWTHYAFVASQISNSMSVYTNGVLLTNKTGMSPFVQGNYDLYIGSAGPNGMGFNGFLDEFRVWKTARSQSQIATNFTHTLVGNEPNLVVYYKFDATNGNIATNFATATGATYNGTLLNNPTWSSAPFVVTNLADSGPGTLRQAVSNTFGSAITFDPALSGQTIVLTNGQIVLNRSITIDASALPNGIRLDGHASSRIFQVGAGVNVVLNSLTLTNGHQISGNLFNSGGAIVNQSSNLTVINCTFVNNADPLGGAIYNDSYSGVILNHCIFSGNQANAMGFGGAFGGGAIFNYGEATATNCTFANNSTDGSGGAIFSSLNGDENAGFTANGCVFYGNSVTNGQQGGGAIFDFGTLTLVNSTFFGNQSSTIGSNGGGALYVIGALGITNCTIFNNQATTTSAGDDGNYGGIEVPDYNSIPLNNSIVCSNTANGTNANVTGISGANNLVDTNPQLLPLGNYGGPTLSMPPLPGSPAIDAGNDAAAAALTTDQRGLPRHVGLHVDIGAVETQAGLTLPATGVSAIAATLNGSIATNGGYYFAYGLTTNYTGFTTTNIISAQTVTAPLTGLTPLTTYHYQLIITNSSGKLLGGDQTFTTLVVPSLSGFASQVLGTNAVTGAVTVQLSANVNSSGLGATLNFPYGLTSAYGAVSSPVSQPSNSPAGNLAVAVSGLVPGNTYHWNVLATNAGGSTIGTDQTFTLSGPSAGSGIPGDLNGDGIVSASEFNAVLGNYLATSPYLLITNTLGLGQSNVTFGLNNSLAGNFTVQFSTNQTTWQNLGPAMPFYSFTDTNLSTAPQRYYRLKYP